MKHHLILMFCAALMLFGVSSLNAQKGEEEYQKGISAIQKKDGKEAVKQLEKAAKKGNDRAMYNLGVLYAEGNLIGQDYEKAVHWYEQAAAQSNSSALYNLGVMYADGKGVEQSNMKARRYLNDAADKGDEMAMNRLGDAYYFGTLGPKNISEGVFWYKKAAEHGHIGAMVNLSAAYANGEGLTQNYVESLNWMLDAAETGDSEAVSFIGKLKPLFSQTGGKEEFMKGYSAYEKGNIYEGFKWFKEAADKGNIHAIEFIGDMYFNGIGVDANEEKAFRYYRVAAENGLAQAMYNLGWMYGTGTGTKKNYEKLSHWVTQSANLGNEDAKTVRAQLNRMEKTGEADNAKGAEALERKDYKLAFRHFSAAADKGSLDAMFNLGLMYEKGEGVKYDHNHAIYWYTVAGEKGDGGSSYRIGVIYYNGLLGKVPNYGVAIEWFERAQSQGIAEAGPALELARQALSKQKRDIAAEEARWAAYMQRQQQRHNPYTSRWEGFTYTPQVQERYNQTIRETKQRQELADYKRDLDERLRRVSRGW